MHINTKSMARILPSIKTFSSLAVLGYKPALIRLVGLCSHRYPTVRVNAAEAVYQVLTEIDDDDSVEAALEVAEMVTEIDW